jgi:hypothetical protein
LVSPQILYSRRKGKVYFQFNELKLGSAYVEGSIE